MFILYLGVVDLILEGGNLFNKKLKSLKELFTYGTKNRYRRRKQFHPKFDKRKIDLCQTFDPELLLYHIF